MYSHFKHPASIFQNAKEILDQRELISIAVYRYYLQAAGNMPVCSMRSTKLGLVTSALDTYTGNDCS